MRNVTLSADPELIDQARRRAESEHTTLNQVFRDWLAEYSRGRGLTVQQIDQILEPVRHFRVGRKLTREEINSR